MKNARPKTPKARRPPKGGKGAARAHPRKAPGKRPAKRPAAAPAALRPEENPRARNLAQTVAQLVLDKKALDVVILDVRGRTSYADYVVVASGESDRQVSAMADNVLEKLREGGIRPLGTEGLETGHWVLLDFGEVVAHLFFQEVRAFYDLEGLWSDAPKEKVA